MFIYSSHISVIVISVKNLFTEHRQKRIVIDLIFTLLYIPNVIGKGKRYNSALYMVK